MSLAIFFAVFFGLLILAVPIGVVFGFSALLPSLLNASFPYNASAAIRSMFTALDSFPMMAIPLFILAGVIMAQGGISKKLFDFFAYFMGNKTAGFPCTVVITCMFYGAISGSGAATVAAVGSLSIPFMVSMGYSLEFSTAIVTVSGGLGAIIPPSIPLVLYSGVTGTSTSDLFIGGVLPGILIGCCLMVYAYLYCKKHGEDKERLQENYRTIKARGFLPVLKDSFWALMAPVIVLGSIYGGIASPTEAAAISIYYSLFISLFVYKTIRLQDIPRLFREGVKTYGSLLFVLATAIAMGRTFALMQVAATLQTAVLSVVSSKVGILLLFNIILLFAGMILDTPPCILLLTPIMYPIATAVGIDPVHFGIIMVVNLVFGFVTPPMGLSLFVASNLSKLPVMSIAKKALPFMVFFLIGVLLINLFEPITMFLVTLNG